MSRLLVSVWLAALPCFAFAEPPRNAAPTANEAWYVDDEEVFANLMDKLAALAKAGRMLPHDKLKAKVKEGVARVEATTPGTKELKPAEVYRAALPSVFIVGSVVKDEDEWLDGRYATAWVLAADGVLVTNWHVFSEMEAGEVFGAADHLGNVYPVTDFLGGSKAKDVAIFRIGATNLVPLPLARQAEPVAEWVAVLSHPGDQFFMFTQGHVSRYSKNKQDDGAVEKWLNITAEYATGSSGGPVLNRFGAVVGMAAMTVSVDFPEEAVVDMGKEKPKEKPEEKAPPASTLQMVVKLAVPGPEILTVLGGKAP